MREKIQSQLGDIDLQISDASTRYNDLITMLNEKKCILAMAALSRDEINSVDQIVVDATLR